MINIKSVLFHLDLLLHSPKAYLFSYTVSTTDKVVIKPYSEAAFKKGSEITKKIKLACPELKVSFVGSTSLGIDGTGDIDIVGSGKKEDFALYVAQLQELLGEPDKVRPNFIDYRLQYKDVPLDVTIMDHSYSSYSRQIKVYQCLKKCSDFRQKYIALKKYCHGKSKREYNLRQMKLMNEILAQA